jgi:hypothetical protein
MGAVVALICVISDIDLNDPGVREATTKIQAAFRSYKTRASIKKDLGTETRE